MCGRVQEVLQAAPRLGDERLEVRVGVLPQSQKAPVEVCGAGCISERSAKGGYTIKNATGTYAELRGKGEVEFVVDDNTTPATVTASFSGVAGTNKAVATGTFASEGAIKASGSVEEHIVFFGEVGSGPVDLEATKVMNTADGSLTLKATGKADFTGPTTMAINGMFRFESGTGRFAGMNGGGSFKVTVDMSATPPQGTGTYTGLLR